MALALVLIGLIAVDAMLVIKRQRYTEETARLRADMTALERARADAILTAEADRTGLMLELARRQSIGDEDLHLAVSSESSFVALDRGGVRLRTMPARLGPERRVGVPPDTLWVAVPLGMRRVERQLAEADSAELPAWRWVDRGQPSPPSRSGVGFLGSGAILTSGGTVLYALPTTGPLADSSYVMPGAVRLAPADLEAIRANIKPGMRVYFY